MRKADQHGLVKAEMRLGMQHIRDDVQIIDGILWVGLGQREKRNIRSAGSSQWTECCSRDLVLGCLEQAPHPGCVCTFDTQHRLWLALGRRGPSPAMLNSLIAVNSFRPMLPRPTMACDRVSHTAPYLY